MTDVGFYQRMAQRAAERRTVQAARADADRRAALAAITRLLPDDDSWLNGWPMLQDHYTVLMGAWVRCAGCGADHGVTCVVIEDGWEWPEKDPDWPYPQDSCPVCAAHEQMIAAF